MSHNEKRVQTKGHSIPFPKNTLKGKSSRISSDKNNKNTISNKIISRINNEDPFLKNNDEIKTTKKFPPKTTRTHIRGNSVELRRSDKKSTFQLPKNKKIMQMKGKSKFEIHQEKSLKQEIHDAKKEIVSSFNKKLDETNEKLDNLQNILIYGFQGLFALIQNDKGAFEEKNNQFQKSVEISNRSKKTFKIEENSLKLKEDNKFAYSSKSGDNNITSKRGIIF